MTLPSIGKLYLILGICLSIVHRTIQIEDADDIFETVAILSQKVMKLEALLSQQDECNCNLTEIEEHIRQNGINVAKNRHDLLVFRDGLEASIQEVSDIFYALNEENQGKIQTNTDGIEANKLNIQSNQETIATNQAGIQSNNDQIQTNQGTIQSNQASIQSNIDAVQDVTNHFNALNDAVKNPVVFAAFRDKAFSNSLYVTGDIGYNVIETNFGNGLNPTYGIFKAPKSGLYEFHFSGQTSDQGDGSITSIKVLLNSYNQFYIWDSGVRDGVTDNNLSYSWYFHMYQGDEIKLSLNDGDVLYVDNAARLYFSGKLIFAD